MLKSLSRHLLLVFICLYFLMPYRLPFLPFTLSTVALTAASVLCLWKLLQHKVPAISSSEVMLWAFLLGSTAFSIILDDTYNFELLSAYALSFITFWVLRINGHMLSNKTLERCANWFCVSCGILSIMQTLFGATFSPAVLMSGKYYISYAVGLTNAPNHLAALILAALGVVVWNLMQKAESKWSAWQLFSLIGAISAIELSLSRAGTIGLVVLMICIGFFDRERHAKRLMYIFLVCALTYAGSFLLVRASQNSEYLDQKWEFVTQGDADFSAMTRWYIIKTGIDALKEHPLLGLGIGNFPYYYAVRFDALDQGHKSHLDRHIEQTPHNAFLEWAMDFGFLSTLGLISIIIYYVGNAFRESKLNISAPFIASLFALMTWMLFHDLFRDRMFWIILGLLASRAMTTTESPANSTSAATDQITASRRPARNIKILWARRRHV